MASIVSVHLVTGRDKYTQKCIVPIRFLENSNVKIKDYVTIQTSEKKYICRVFLTKLPLTYILVDNLVTSVEFRQSNNFRQWESVNIPDDLMVINPSTFDHVAVKVIFKDNENSVDCDKMVYEDIVHKILTNYVIEKDCVINCSGLKLADFMHIHSILVCDTFQTTHKYGKLPKASKVEVIDMNSIEQIYQIEEFRHIKLGGMSNFHNSLKLNLILPSSRVLVTGPSGCGKSSCVKKFCSNINCYFYVMNGLKTSDLTVNKCEILQKRFASYLKMFPNRTCILFIDHIDVIAPYDLKQKSVERTSMLVNLIHQLKDGNIAVVAAANQKNIINPAVASLFDKEVNLGIPSREQRKEMIKCLTESLTCDIDYNKVAQKTPGFVGHDISSLVREAINAKKAENDEDAALTTEDFERALCSVSPSILKTSAWNIKVKPIYWKDIGGMFNIKKRLQMCIEMPLRNPEIFKKVDLPCPRGVLLYGPPGCCKTTLARGLATECNANFFAASPAQIYSPYVGESEKNITELFYQARLCAPSIIFLDELDSLVSQRKLDKKSQGIGEKVLSALLNEMDGFGTKVQFQNTSNMQKLLNIDGAVENIIDDRNEVDCKSNDDVIVVAATNRPDLIDDALLRPGRFDVILYVPPPSLEERESILHTLTKDMPLENIDMKQIAENTHLFSGADLKSLCNEAAMNALRKDMSASHIIEENFSDALKKIKPSITKEQIAMYEKLSSKYGSVIK